MITLYSFLNPNSEDYYCLNKKGFTTFLFKGSITLDEF